ncbi:MAG: lipopolysaccharide biosynthesis protein [Bacteroidaceae bacterium]|nr:lipopolysaccharide biosynthesis protein [Bacteroidaceae bacterium]MBQ5838768.1 lipopolysaccharide biosynthesis protein [Bacteroidaceae bacterium]
MANLKSLAKDTAIYGLSSIVGRFLNYLLVPLYTHVISAANGGYGIVTNLYGYVALLLVILVFGMETTFFRFANNENERPNEVFSNAMLIIGTLVGIFLAIIFGGIEPISQWLGYSEHPEYIQIMASIVALDALQAIPFSFLRFQKRAIKFASLKLLFIILNISLNLLYFVVLGHTDVFYIFMLNLVCTSIITFFFLPELVKMKWQINMQLLRRMLSYSWPILILGIAGILNQTADKMVFPLIYPNHEEGVVELGVYGACVKVAMIMAMITQAFRYAYEPFVFAQSRDKDKNETYAIGMKYFLIFTLLAFLCVMAYLPMLKYLVGEDYWAGLRVIPIVMAAEIMMGIYFNLSFWYKLIDKTIYGAWFSIAGCLVLFAVNIIFIPKYSYMACAWGGFAGYGTAMTLSYIVGQRKNPINYPLKSMAIYVGITLLFFSIMQALPDSWSPILRMAINTVLVIAFIGHIIYHDLPLRNLPVIGKYFR